MFEITQNIVKRREKKVSEDLKEKRKQELIDMGKFANVYQSQNTIQFHHTKKGQGKSGRPKRILSEKDISQIREIYQSGKPLYNISLTLHINRYLWKPVITPKDEKIRKKALK